MRNRKKLGNNAPIEKKPSPISTNEEVKNSTDQRIDEDFPGFPNHPSTEKAIKGKDENDKELADRG
jgi:hypothetical protein